MSSAAPTFDPVPTVNLACFEVDSQTFALEVGYVREVVRVQEIVPLPKAPALIEGLIDLRGHLIPVLDLARALGRGRANSSGEARIVVVHDRGLVFGLWVDAATGVLNLEDRRLTPVPELATRDGYAAVRGVVRRSGDTPVMVLSIDDLIETVCRTAPSEIAALGENT
jgi:purine-binding chemotaxis protein CheW